MNESKRKETENNRHGKQEKNIKNDYILYKFIVKLSGVVRGLKF